MRRLKTFNADPDAPVWTRSKVLGLAKFSCCTCHGYGLRRVYNTRDVPCHCVFRAIFRACYNRYRDCVAHADQAGTVQLEFCAGKDGRRCYSRKKEEFIADFYLVARRTLDAAAFRVFDLHFLLGADWRFCTRRLAMDRGNFFHAVYGIEQTLGRTFAELKPHALYPLDEYFGGVRRRTVTSMSPLPALPEEPLSLDVPLKAMVAA